MTLDELIMETRIRLRNPSDTELPYDSIRFAIEDALGELSEVQPLYTYVAIDLTKNEELYDVDDGIINVASFWFTPEMTSTMFTSVSDVFGEDVPMPGYFMQDNKHIFHSPSMMNVFEEKLERMRVRREYSWEFNADTGKLLIMPPPSKNGKGVYKGVLKRTLDDIPEKFIGPFKQLVKAEAMLAFAEGQAQIESMPVGVGIVSYNVSGYRGEANRLKEQALSKLRDPGSVVVIR